MERLDCKPGIHIWVFNHAYFGISDQVDFLTLALQQQGYSVSVGNQPRAERLNIVIENFSERSRDTLMAFCKAHGKRVAVVMTEHLDFVDEQIRIHGEPLWSNNDYMHPATQVARIRHLFECLPYICSFLVLGDLPELLNIHRLVPGVAVRTINFPNLAFEPGTTQHIDQDLLFTGVVTQYRGEILELLRLEGFALACPGQFLPHEQRDTLNRSARLVLNIPQRVDWPWLSLMRVIPALRVGRVTVSLGTADTSQIASCCLQLDLSAQDWLEQLRHHIANAVPLYGRMHANYQAMAQAFARQWPFPHDMFIGWQMTDQVPLLPAEQPQEFTDGR
ncbi:hypothetical protein [Pseudomonas turukhanskensis]|uniref:Glycosyltransferase n=1 Tax=Pseudomonas turukhanskensis TaxID=1806536 RepID=A0A9W6K2S8_9PSED|nr:hypothetical protein [Pseudomonas turukhanskensis]GLK87737.1 hypothetical protein GCM10017655_07990 [Pseudomonas turukhanskensis]